MATRSRYERTKDIRKRASTPEPMYSYCRIMGCPNTTTAGAGQGLNRKYCRKHEEHFDRHGSYLKGSYRLADIEPHRKAALRWLKAHTEATALIRAKAVIERLYRNAGPKVEAFRLSGLTPEERARAAWARLRESGVDPVRPLAAWLAIEATIAADPQPELKQEYKRVQAAKLVHRMASGSHKQWERPAPNGKTRIEELHRYPHSRGRVLRHLGKQLEEAAGGLAGAFLSGSLKPVLAKEE